MRSLAVVVFAVYYYYSVKVQSAGRMRSEYKIVFGI
jgi:hypothetical protein